MILRRFADAIREQNWFSVVLEMTIVVFSILIGLQVDDWNQRRIERQSDQRALALFIDELQFMLNEAKVDLRYVTTSFQDLSLGVEIAQKCDASDEERARLIAAIGDTFNWRVPDIRPSGLVEIGNSGTLARLGNTELSRAVGSIHQGIKGIDDSMYFIAPQFDRAWQMLLPYLIVLELDRLEKADLLMARPTSEYLSLVTQDTLCRSQEFLLGLALLRDFYRSSYYNFDEWNRVLATAYDLAEAESQ